MIRASVLKRYVHVFLFLGASTIALSDDGSRTGPEAESGDCIFVRHEVEGVVATFSTLQLEFEHKEKASSSTLNVLTTSVTQELFEAVMDYNPSEHVGPRLPVNNVPYHEALAFAETFGELIGEDVRLLTDYEWHALWDRSREQIMEDLDAFAWLADHDPMHFPGPPREVAQKKRDINCLYDFQGNVMEWVSYPDAPAGEAKAMGSHIAVYRSLFESDRYSQEVVVRSPLTQYGGRTGFRVAYQSSIAPNASEDTAEGGH